MRQYKEYIVSADELHKLQRIELEMLIEVDRICSIYGIDYSLDGGTLLGAVRHKGFIPWDDDIDVIMLRKEYERFREACKIELDTNRFFLQDHLSDPHYYWGWAKLRREGTEHVRLGQEGLKQKTGVFIDIFVADQVPNHMLLRRIHHAACYLVQKLLYARLGVMQARNPISRTIYRVLSKVEKEKAFAMRDWLVKSCNRHKTELISHYTLPYPKSCKYGLPRKCFDAYIELEFEGRKFKAFKDYDTYLTLHYGDYMTLPPLEKRVGSLKVSKLDLSGVDI